MILEHFLLKLHHWSALRVQSIPIGVKLILNFFYYISFSWEMWARCKVFWYGGEICYSKRGGPLWTKVAPLSLEHQHLSPLLLSSGQSENGRAGILCGRLKYFLPIAWHTHLVVHQHSVEDEDERINRPNGKVACTSSWACPPHSRNEARHQVKSTRSSISQTDPLLI